MPLIRFAALLALVAVAQPSGSPGALVYFGTYTGATSKGVYVSRLDSSTGALTAPVLAAETPNPSFLAVHPGGRFLYAVNEVSAFEGEASGSITAFSIDRASGTLARLNAQPSAGADPAHLVVGRGGRHVIVANYSGSTVAVLPIAPDGRLQPPTAVVRHSGSSVNKERQSRPHPHGIAIDTANRFAYVTDLGLDEVSIYRFDAVKGSLVSADDASVAPGSGPRHIALHPGGRFAYVINELTCTLTVFSVRAGGELAEVQTLSTLPAGHAVQAGYSTAEVMVHPSGRFVYGSNRGHDTIAAFAVDAASGRLSLIEHEPTQGRTPRGFGIDPDGRFLVVANQRSDTVVVLRIDAAAGTLDPTGHRITVGSPVSVEFVR